MISNLALALAEQPGMTISSDLLGPLTVGTEEQVEFPAGLFGFPECRRFVLVPAEREGLFWLQSAEHSALTFLLVDPFRFFQDFAVDLASADLAELQTQDASEMVILAIVTLPRTRLEAPTANLQGPIAINLRSRLAKQLAIAEPEYGVRCPFSLSED